MTRRIVIAGMLLAAGALGAAVVEHRATLGALAGSPLPAVAEGQGPAAKREVPDTTTARPAPHPADTVAFRVTAAGPPVQLRPGSIRFPAGNELGQAPGEWIMPGRDYANTRYSPLADITVANAKDLKPVSVMSTGIPHGHEGQPLVVGTTMYVVTPYPNLLLAIDLTVPGGAVKWKYDPHADPRAVGIACCDVVNRGLAYADGKLVYNTLDAHTVAVDAATGHEVWKTKVGNIEIGETITMAPIIAKGRVFVGNSGAELGVRGYLAALDLGSGRILWRAYNTGPDSEVLIGPKFKAFYPKDRGRDLGVTTWPKDQWKLGGSTVWGWVSYDPETDIVYYSTANPGVWNPDVRPGSNKWSASIFAREAATGQARWAFQQVEHDSWDYDAIMESILVDMPFGGRMRKLLIHPGRTGFVYTHDRVTGELLAAGVFQPINWARGVSLKTGLHDKVPEKQTHDGVVTRNICPSSTGAKDQQPSAFSPRTALVYIPAHNVCMDYEGVEANYIAGTPYLGASVKMYPGPGGYRGELVAWDPIQARKVCGVREDLPLWSGVLATGGDVVFYGTMDGWFKAIDARNCRELWKFKTGSGIVGNPITYQVNGKQFIAVYSGVGGWMGAVAFPSISTDDPYAGLGVVGAVPDIKKKTAPGGALYVFSL